MEGGLKFRRHHGKERIDRIRDIEDINIVLTTYHTIAVDWNRWKSSGSHVMFSVRWKRIILDEGELIDCDDRVELRMVKVLITNSTSHSKC